MADNSVSELWAKITAIPRPHKLVDFPRNDPATGKSVGQIAIWVLTQEEQMLCASHAEATTRKFIKEAPKDQHARGYEDLYSNAAAIEYLFRSCRKPDDVSKQFFPAPQAIRQSLSTDEVGVLLGRVLAAQAEMGPMKDAVSDEDVDATIEKIQAGEDALSALSRGALQSMVTALVSRIDIAAEAA